MSNETGEAGGPIEKNTNQLSDEEAAYKEY
jgi:hypothetical protein